MSLENVCTINTIPSVFGSGWGRQLKDGGCLVLDNFHLLAELDPTKLKITLIPDLVIGTL